MAKKNINWKHGGCVNGKSTLTYRAWACMRQRCLNPNAANYKNYGGRGITICRRWDKFENFLADMGEHPGRPKYSLGRKDNDGPYSPKNCEWQTAKQQSNNQRPVHIPYDPHRGYGAMSKRDRVAMARFAALKRWSAQA